MNASQSATGTASGPEPTPFLVVEGGHPSGEEVAALVSVFGALLTAAAPAETAANRWGQAVDGLRYSVMSWQHVTLLEREKVKRPISRITVPCSTPDGYGDATTGA